MDAEISIEVTKKVFADELPGWTPYDLKPRQWHRVKWEVAVTANRSQRLLMIVTDNYDVVQEIINHYQR